MYAELPLDYFGDDTLLQTALVPDLLSELLGVISRRKQSH